MNKREFIILVYIDLFFDLKRINRNILIREGFLFERRVVNLGVCYIIKKNWVELIDFELLM